MRLRDERRDLLLAILKADMPAEDLTRLRLALFLQDGALDGVIRAADRRQILANAIDGLEAKGLLHPARPGDGKPGSLRSRLTHLREELVERRTKLRAGLTAIIEALNTAGIEPLVLKGSVSLLTGEPAWRYQRDIDLAVHRHEARQAVDILREIGFAEDAEARVPRRHHHLQPMWRPGLPAGVELHVRLSGRRSAHLLPGALLLEHAVAVRFDRLKVRLLRNDHFLLHGLLHHHFQNLGVVFGTISLKGLLEFAHAQQSLDDDDVRHLQMTLANRPRLASAVELWTAACAELLGQPFPKGAAPGGFASRRAAAIKSRLENAQMASRWQALREDIGGSLDVLGRSRPGFANAVAWPSVYCRPVFDSLRRRGVKRSEAKERRVSGLVGEI